MNNSLTTLTWGETTRTFTHEGSAVMVANVLRSQGIDPVLARHPAVPVFDRSAYEGLTVGQIEEAIRGFGGKPGRKARKADLLAQLEQVFSL